MSRAGLASAIIGAALAVAASGHAASPQTLSLDLKPCQVGKTGATLCGVFRVPEDRSKRGGRVLPLKVIVLKAKAQTPKEPIFFLSGGPGQGATDQAEGFWDSWMRDDHDIVLMDLRGTGEGTAQDCPPGSEDDLQGYLEPPLHGVERLRACRARLERTADLTRYTTAIAMDDLDALRQAMGYERIDIYGGSYGTRAGLAYIHAYGAHVRLAVMTGLSAMENRSPLYHAAAAQRAFDRVVAQCEAQPACKTAFPHIKADLALVQGRLRAAPAKVAVRHPVTGKEAEVMLDAGSFAEGLRGMLYSSESGRRIPLLLKRATEGDLQPFAQTALRGGYLVAHALHTGLLLSVSCPEDVARIRPGDIEKETAGTFLGDRRVADQMAGCAVWPKAAMPAGYYGPFRSDVPALLVSGDLDPVTPPTWVGPFSRYLPNSLSVVFPGAHTEANDCLETIVRQFIDRGSPKGIDTSCVAAVKLPPFVLSEPAA
jgi:pimeloyl-ACP methyl ester carboxylesterase